MTDKQIWQTISLDLRRAAQYLYAGSKSKANYFLNEAELLKPKIYSQKFSKALMFWNKDNAEDLLLTSTLLNCKL